MQNTPIKINSFSASEQEWILNRSQMSMKVNFPTAPSPVKSQLLMVTVAWDLRSSRHWDALWILLPVMFRQFTCYSTSSFVKLLLFLLELLNRTHTWAESQAQGQQLQGGAVTPHPIPCANTELDNKVQQLHHGVKGRFMNDKYRILEKFGLEGI